MNDYKSWKVTPFAMDARSFEPVTIVLGARLSNAILASNARYTSIGVMRQGPSFGLLCVGPEGEYVRVNGSYVEKLDFQLVTSMLARLHARTEAIGTFETRAIPRAEVKVTIRKRLVNPLDYAQQP